MSRSKDQRAGYYILVDKLAQRFGSVRQQNKWLSKFKDRKQQQGESFSALEDEWQYMAHKAYRNLYTLPQAALPLNQLYKSISLEIKGKYIGKKRDTVNTPVEIIKNHEDFFSLMIKGTQSLLGSWQYKQRCYRWRFI